MKVKVTSSNFCQIYSNIIKEMRVPYSSRKAQKKLIQNTTDNKLYHFLRVLDKGKKSGRVHKTTENVRRGKYPNKCFSNKITL